MLNFSVKLIHRERNVGGDDASKDVIVLSVQNEMVQFFFDLVKCIFKEN